MKKIYQNISKSLVRDIAKGLRVPPGGTFEMDDRDPTVKAYRRANMIEVFKPPKEDTPEEKPPEESSPPSNGEAGEEETSPEMETSEMGEETPANGEKEG